MKYALELQSISHLLKLKLKLMQHDRTLRLQMIRAWVGMEGTSWNGRCRGLKGMGRLDNGMEHGLPSYNFLSWRTNFVKQDYLEVSI